VPTRRVTLHDEAAADYDAAFEWYAERSPDASRKFDAEVERAIGELAEAPDRWAACMGLGASCYGDFLFC
jgi:plasmid stabilization system protein ParE